MKLKKLTLKNFQSYQTLSFDYADLGLSLVSGETGAGKSTLLDAPVWILFGTTSKDSATDDVKAWGGEGLTEGTLSVDLGNEVIDVTRIRGTATKNDLFWVEPNGETKRGKDLNETQKLLEQRIGVSSELFLMSAYMHQFSRADSFFIAKAKERREVLEKIADQEFAILVAEKSSEERKQAKKDKEQVELDNSKLTGQRVSLENSLSQLKDSLETWEINRKSSLAVLRKQSDKFTEDKQKEITGIVAELEALDKQTKPVKFYVDAREKIEAAIKSLEPLKSQHKDLEKIAILIDSDLRRTVKEYEKYQKLKGECPVCMGPTDNPKVGAYLGELKQKGSALELELGQKNQELNQLTYKLQSIQDLDDELGKLQTAENENTRLLDKFTSLENKLKYVSAQENPHTARIKDLESQVNPTQANITKTEAQLRDVLKAESAASASLEALQKRVSGLTWLYDKSFELRGLLMEKVVSQVNDNTNELLERFFDAGLRVILSLADSDKLNVDISNNGYTAPFKQLSGGERCMLKLAFSLSVMKAAQNKAGIHFGTIMLDEALNGLDDSLKVKAFSLLQKLETDYESVLLIDHCEEFKNLFNNRFEITKSEGYSAVESVRD